jgi:phosphate transport system permease protein
MAAASVGAAGRVRAASSLRQRRFIDRLATVLLWAAAIAVILMLAAFIAYIFYLGAPAISWHFLTAPPAEATAGGGIGPEIYNSFYILFLTLIFTVPIATAAGIYLQEYARPGAFTAAVQFCAESLATIPSIVMGLFGLIVFVNLLGWKFTAMGGALTLTILNLPALMRVTQEALSSVPGIYREGSMALGSTKWQTIRRVVLPSAIAPLTTGIVLISGRIFGETAALIYTAGLSVSAGNSAFDLNPFRVAETLSVHLWYTHSESLVPDATLVGNGSALVLLAMVLIFNVAARLIGRALTKRLTAA